VDTRADTRAGCLLDHTGRQVAEIAAALSRSPVSLAGLSHMIGACATSTPTARLTASDPWCGGMPSARGPV